MKAIIYANYGVLAHEYQTIYTVTAPHANATCHETCTVSIPDGYKPYETAHGDIALTIGNRDYLLSEILASTKTGAPCLIWVDGGVTHRIVLRIVED